MLELWHECNSVHSFKLCVARAEKKLDWTGHRLELLKFEHLQPDYLRLNPNGVVPTLVHDGRVILESSVICQYLDEAFPEPADFTAAKIAIFIASIVAAAIGTLILLPKTADDTAVATDDQSDGNALLRH